MTTFPFDSWRQTATGQVNAFLAECSQGPAQRLQDAMRYSLVAGGKRLRPLLCIASAELFGGSLAQALPAACAIEMLHTYSLIHDDLPAMDNDDLRRGKPSNHRAFDEATAILAGDALQTCAFEQLANGGNYSDTQRLHMLRTLSAAAGAGGMVAGQMQDMQAENSQLCLADLETMHRLKTGRLIEASLMIGGQLADANTAALEGMAQLGQLIGLAFQVRDDILDVTASSEQLGKQQGKDADQHKSTFPALLGLEESQRYAARLGDEAIVLLDQFGQQAAALRALTQLIVNRQS